MAPQVFNINQLKFFIFDFDADRIALSVHITNDFQALFSGGGPNQFYSRHDINQGFPFPAFADVTKQPVLYFIPF